MKMNFIPSTIFFYVVIFISGAIAISSSNWIFTVAAMALNSAAILPLLVSYSPFKSSYAETAAKYFMVQAKGTTLYAMGATIHDHWDVTDASFMSLSYVQWGLVLMTLGLFAKIGVFPFSAWVPGVTIGASWLNCWVLLTWQKYYLCVVLAQLLNDPASKFLFWPVGMAIGLTALHGAYLGVTQTNLRSILGCSSLAHTGWAIMACLLNTEALSFYFAVYCLTLGFTLIVFHLTEVNNTQDPFLMMKGGWDTSLLSFTSTINMLSLGGMPPLLGFMGKWAVLSQWVEHGHSMLPLCTVMLASFLSLLFYMNMIWGAMWRLSTESATKPKSGLLMGLILISHIIMGIFWSILFVF
uniref:NADH dehydrogenase subunit 2 n=1 Tax=Scurria scurra TaxID=351200 RepID=UPI001EE0D865|nr:NADH dehydrogenase subunit 2 [Scurria scurra]UHY95078.1 NADH dehydrogenase subunit 2 [Scurria scurra]